MRIVIGGIVLFVAVFGLDFLIHGVFLLDTYRETAAVWRPEVDMQKLHMFMFGSQIIFAFVFFGFFLNRIKEGVSKIHEGLVFGFFVGLLLVPANLMWYCVLPIPLSLAIRWAAFGLIECSILGILAGFLAPKNSR